MSTLRRMMAVFACVPLAILLVYSGLVALLSILTQVLAQFVDLSDASLTSFLSPAVLFGLQSPGGSGGILEAIFGGPGAPGGTVSRYLIFVLSAGIAAIMWIAMRAIWAWGFSPRQISGSGGKRE